MNLQECFMSFKRYDGYIGSVPQKKIDEGLPLCPFCGEKPNWLIEFKNSFSSSDAICMCEKCNGKVFMKNKDYSFEDNLHIVDVGSKNLNSLKLNDCYHINTLKYMSRDISQHKDFFDNDYTSKPNSYNYEKENNNKKTGVIIAVIAFIVAFVSLMWIIMPGSLGTPTSKNLEFNESPTMSVEELYGNYYVTISGYAKNTSKKTMDYVSITFTLYDSSGNVVGTAIDNQSSLGAGETWVYSAMGVSTTNRPVYCKASDITVLCY